MSEKNLNTDGSIELIEEVSTSGNGLAKVAVVGAVIALGVAAVVIIKKRRANKSIEVEETIEVKNKSNTSK